MSLFDRQFNNLRQPPHREPESGEAQTPMVYIHQDPTYEFKLVMRDLREEPAPGAETLNAFGEDGWIIAGMFTYEHKLHLYMQRRK